ncbi:MAG: signal peptidase I [Candidatus Eisenbacteria bacterium]|uniref:Signal peptidase I n=1 Tax=Eiseniibacteriota bacterium TaxID=2212470 RepID=A0A849SND9_UNCEI|nr:signal peptidase I [Candidatus Eisenbacteria bacterium]
MDTGTGLGMGMGFFSTMLGLCALMITSNWIVFEKAGQAGWKALIPIYGAVVFMRILERPWWWVLWLCVPLLNLIPACIVCLDLARKFGKSAGWAVGLALLPFVFLPMLAFTDARYVGPRGSPQRPFARAA